MRDISQIIEDAGGARKIEEAAGLKLDSKGALKPRLTADAVRKWRRFGIPDRHWSILIDLAGATPDELFAANLDLRAPEPAE